MQYILIPPSLWVRPCTSHLPGAIPWTLGRLLVGLEAVRVNGVNVFLCRNKNQDEGQMTGEGEDEIG